MMDEEGRSKDRAGRRAKRLLTPLQKYDIYLQLVRGEVTMAEAAAAAGVDRSTVLRIRQVAKDGALAALADSPAGHQGRDTSLPTTNTKAAASRSARPARPAWNGLDRTGLRTTERPGNMINTGIQKDPTMLANTTRSCIANSETPQWNSPGVHATRHAGRSLVNGRPKS